MCCSVPMMDGLGWSGMISWGVVSDVGDVGDVIGKHRLGLWGEFRACR